MISISDFLKKFQSTQLTTVKDNKNSIWYNVPAAFDIETTSFYANGIHAPENKRAVMYHWQFGIDDFVTYGRTWEEFTTFVELLSAILDLSPNRRLVVYVHNLPYEFQFLRERFTWDKVFLLEDRKPVYASHNGLEFRCSLKLSGGKSLANVGKDLIKHDVKKMEGDLDYEILRSPLTPLTPEEQLYCENDIRVLLAYIAEKIEQDGDITKIPLTNTGYVRNYCRKKCYSRYRPYRRIMDELTIEPDEFSQLKRAFMGGHTHANARYVRKVLHGIASYDFKSSYPAVMVQERFPMSKAHKIDRGLSDEEFAKLLRTKACMFRPHGNKSHAEAA